MRGVIHKRASLVILVLAVALLLLTGGTAAVYAQTGGGYDLTWWTVDSGGGTLSSGGYTLVSAAGQPDAGVPEGGDYALVGGFWGGAAQYHVYLPLILQNP